jgi:hypothetical protein
MRCGARYSRDGDVSEATDIRMYWIQTLSARPKNEQVTVGIRHRLSMSTPVAAHRTRALSEMLPAEHWRTWPTDTVSRSSVSTTPHGVRASFYDLEAPHGGRSRPTPRATRHRSRSGRRPRHDGAENWIDPSRARRRARTKPARPAKVDAVTRQAACPCRTRRCWPGERWPPPRATTGLRCREGCARHKRLSAPDVAVDLTVLWRASSRLS